MTKNGPKVFFKKRLCAEESGLIVFTDRFVSIRETECFHYCIPEKYFHLIASLKRKDESEIQYAKRFKVLKRIHKDGSRIAFETEEKAMEHLRFLKRKQLNHMQRETKFIEKFLGSETLNPDGPYERVPDSYDLVHDYLRFD